MYLGPKAENRLEQNERPEAHIELINQSQNLIA